MCQPEVRLYFERNLQLLYGLIVLTVMVKELSQPRVCNRRKRVKVEGVSCFSNSLCVPAHVRQKVAVKPVSHRIIRIEFDSSFERCFCTCPVPIEPEFDSGKRNVGLGESV